MKIKKDVFLDLLFLELICYTPAAIILGNIFSPIAGLKVHWIYIGIIFVLSILLLVKYNRAVSLGFVILGSLFFQGFNSIDFSIKEFIDFISGPFLLIAVVDTACYSNISIDSFIYYKDKFIAISMVPIFISVLQYFDFLPLEFMNASYVNVTIFGSEKIERVNGFLYHGVELAVLIFFVFVILALNSSSFRVYFLFLIMFQIKKTFKIM